MCNSLELLYNVNSFVLDMELWSGAFAVGKEFYPYLFKVKASTWIKCNTRNIYVYIMFHLWRQLRDLAMLS